MQFQPLPLPAAALLAAALPAAGGIRLSITNKSLGGQNERDTRSSQRQLVVELA